MKPYQISTEVLLGQCLPEKGSHLRDLACRHHTRSTSGQGFIPLLPCAHTPAVLLASFSRKGLLTPAFASSVFAVLGGWTLRLGHMLQLTALDGTVLCSGTSCLFLHLQNGNSEISTSRLCDKSFYTGSLGSQEKHRMRVANIYRERRMGDMGR